MSRKPLSKSELSMARQSIDVFHEKIDRKSLEYIYCWVLAFNITLLKNRFSHNTRNGSSQGKDRGERSQKISEEKVNFNHHEDEEIESHHKNSKYLNQMPINSSQNKYSSVNEGNSGSERNSSSLGNDEQLIITSLEQNAPIKTVQNIFNNELLDDNLLNDDLNDQFNDSVLLMTKQVPKFHSPEYFNKLPGDDFTGTNNLVRSHLSEPQLLDGIEQELFGKNTEIPSNNDVLISQFHDNHHSFDNSNSLDFHTKENIAQVQMRPSIILNEKFKPIISEIQKDFVEHADFTYADMGDEGLFTVCEALHNNKKLKSLKLQRNKISDKGASALIEQLINGKSNVQQVYLQDNMISDKFLDFLLQKCSKQPSMKLENVYLKNNLLNLNKSHKLIQELKKYSVNIHL